MKKHYRKDNNCLNCGTLLSGKYCHNCGQENLEIKESFVHMVNHAVSDYFHFDHQFFHTLVPLFFKPGKLTNEYMAGKRMQYLHPVKMYIFISLVFFFLYFKKDSNEKKEVEVKKTTTEKASIVRDSVKNALSKIPNLTEKQREDIEKKYAGSGKKPAKKSVDEDEEDGSIFNTDYDKTIQSYEDYLKQQSKLTADERDNFIERYAVKKNIEWKKQGKSGREIKEVFFESFKHNIPKLMFVLLPFFALMFRLAFYKNRKYFVEHLIFTIHLHCFLFSLLAINILTNFILPETWSGVRGWITFATTVAITLYIYRSLKTVYKRSRFRTITKMLGMSVVYFAIVIIGFMSLLAITAVTAI
jgi:hypothetical protein